MNNIYEIVAAAIGGGVIQQGFSFILAKRKENRTDFLTMSEMLNKDIKVLKEENASLENMRDVLYESLQLHEKQLMEIRFSLQLNQASELNIPYPAWFESTGGLVLALNVEYDKTFLAPKNLNDTDHIGKNISEVWQNKMLSVLKEANMEVKKKGIWISPEPIELPGTNGEVKKWLILKYLQKQNGMTTGIGARAIPME